MKFFTPELYLAFNSEETAVVHRAESDWEQAIENYQGHVKSIRGKLPEKTRTRAEELCLHDSEYLALITIPAPQSTETLSLVVLEQNGERIFLIYLSPREPFITQPIANWKFSRTRVHWLYDEVDMAGDDFFAHEILLSDGRVISLRFSSFDVMKSAEPRPMELVQAQ